MNIFVGGPPAMTLAAVMPLPEGMSELGFAGALGRRRVRMLRRPDGLPVHADADFAIVGTVIPNKLLPEGPFGDHLGYYSLEHDFPVLAVEHVYHRDGAIWPFTVVGRPPQEDTVFGQLIHEITGAAIPGGAARCARDPRGRRGGRASAALGDRQRTLLAVCRNCSGRRNCSPRPTPSSAKASCRWPSSC